MNAHHTKAVHAASIAVLLFFSPCIFALSKEVEDALALLKDTHIEQCQRNKLKVELLVAHRKHDMALLKELEVKLDELNKILQPTENKLNALKAKIKKNPDQETEFNTALLELGSCE